MYARNLVELELLAASRSYLTLKGLGRDSKKGLLYLSIPFTKHDVKKEYGLMLDIIDA